MKIISVILGLGGLLLTLGSCKQDGVSNLEVLQPLLPNNYEWNVPSYTEFRTATPDLSPERYLGQSFNLIKYAYNDARGFGLYPILSPDKPAWSPFGREIEEEGLEAVVRQFPDPETKDEVHQNISSISKVDSIGFSATASYKTNSLTYTTQDVTRHKMLHDTEIRAIRTIASSIVWRRALCTTLRRLKTWNSIYTNDL